MSCISFITCTEHALTEHAQHDAVTEHHEHAVTVTHHQNHKIEKRSYRQSYICNLIHNQVSVHRALMKLAWLEHNAMVTAVFS